jgi:glycosyltransferase involved in cell wall biosynthesis
VPREDKGAARKPVIIYVQDLRASGVVVAATEFARWLGERRETILCAGYAEGHFRDADVHPARLAALGKTPGRNPRLTAARGLRALVRTVKPAAIFSMGNLGHRSVLWGAASMRVRTIYLISKDVRQRKNRKKRLRANARRLWLIGSAHRVVLVGRELLSAPLFRQAAERGRAVYIPNGVDVAKARRMAQAPVPHPWLKDKREPVVISVGRIRKQKNQEALVEAIALARERVPCRLIILGEGRAEDVERLKRLTETLGIAEHVLFAGVTDNVFAWLARSDLFALPSRWEGSSIALLEAMAVGVPVLASTQAGDAAHVLDNGAYGVLVDAHSVVSIADGIVRQLSGEPVLPGPRAEAFDLEKTHERYAALIDA